MRAPSPLSANPLLAIFEVSQALVSSTEYSEVLAKLAAKIGEAMNVASCNILAYVPEQDACIHAAFWKAEGTTEVERATVGTFVNLRDRPDLRDILSSPGLAERHADDPDLNAVARENIESWGFKAMLDMPLRVGDEPIGSVGVQETEFPRRFTQTERDLFGWLCELASLGIHNADLMRRQQNRSRHLASLVAINKALASAHDPQQVFATIARAAATALGAPLSTVYEYSAGADTLTARAVHEPPGWESKYQLDVPLAVDTACVDPSVLTDREPLVEHVSDLDLTPEIRQDLIDCDEKTVISVPIVFRGEALGVLLIMWTGQERLLSGDELALARCMGRQAALVLHNARLRGGVR
jgi:GAF domain-containing protein